MKEGREARGAVLRLGVIRLFDRPHHKGSTARSDRRQWGRRKQGDGSSVISMSSGGRALRSKDQEGQQKNLELGREKAYSSMAKYFLRFSRRQG